MTTLTTRQEEIERLEQWLSSNKELVERIRKEMREEAPPTYFSSKHLLFHFRSDEERQFFISWIHQSLTDKSMWDEDAQEEDWFNFDKGFSVTIPERLRLKNMSYNSAFQVICNQPETNVIALERDIAELKSQEEN